MPIIRRIPFLFIALIAYYLPWVYHKTAALTANAYDLAEWVSIHPAVRNSNPPLLAPFMLRSVLLGLAILFGLYALRSRGLMRWLYTGFAVTLAITLLPPLDFFRGGFDDPNYRQQFVLAIGAIILLVGLAIAYRRYDAWLRWLEILLIGVVVVAAVLGEVLAWNVVQSLGIIEAAGGGIILFEVALVGQLMSLLLQQRSTVKS